MTTRQRNDDHLTTSQVAAMLDRRLHPAERRAAIAHLSSCLECRHELAEMQHALTALGAEPRPERRWYMIVAGVAAAFVIAAVPVVLRSSQRSFGASPVGATRAGSVPVDASLPIDVIAPAEGAEIAAGSRLAWHARGLGASYLVTVQDTSGVMIWSSSLTDTSATLPSNVLVAGRRYFWSVDARLADGSSAKSEVHVFRVP